MYSRKTLRFSKSRKSPSTHVSIKVGKYQSRHLKRRDAGDLYTMYPDNTCATTLFLSCFHPETSHSLVFKDFSNFVSRQRILMLWSHIQCLPHSSSNFPSPFLSFSQDFIPTHATLPWTLPLEWVCMLSFLWVFSENLQALSRLSQSPSTCLAKAHVQRDVSGAIYWKPRPAPVLLFVCFVLAN